MKKPRVQNSLPGTVIFVNQRVESRETTSANNSISHMSNSDFFKMRKKEVQQSLTNLKKNAS